MAWPQYVVCGYLGLLAVGGFFIDGHEKRGTYSASDFWLTAGAWAWVLWMGGFWK